MCFLLILLLGISLFLHCFSGLHIWADLELDVSDYIPIYFPSFNFFFFFQ